MNQALNEVTICGLLKEINVDEKVKPDTNRKYVAGTITFAVEYDNNGIYELSEIPVKVFAYEKKNDGGKNPAYESIKELMTKGVSFAAVGEKSKADRYEFRRGTLTSSTWEPEAGRIVTYSEIRASFFNKSRSLVDKAEFMQEIVICQIADELDSNNDVTGRLIVTGFNVGYGDRVSELSYIVENPQAINYIRSYWKPDDTVKITGRISRRLKDVVVEKSDSLSFGEASTEVYQNVVKEFIITGGSEPYERDMAYDVNEVARAIAAQKAKETSKTKAQSNSRGF